MCSTGLSGKATTPYWSTRSEAPRRSGVRSGRSRTWSIRTSLTFPSDAGSLYDGAKRTWPTVDLSRRRFQTLARMGRQHPDGLVSARSRRRGAALMRRVMPSVRPTVSTPICVKAAIFSVLLQRGWRSSVLSRTSDKRVPALTGRS